MKISFHRRFSAPQHAKITDRYLSRMLISSALSILVCAVCLLSVTLAWFTDSLQTGTSQIVAAQYALETTLTDSNGAVISAAADGSYPLLAGNYTVRLTATGEASTGYGKLVTPSDSYYYTQQIAHGDALEFTLLLPVDGSVSVIAQWGTYSGTPEISDGSTVGSLPSLPVSAEETSFKTPSSAEAPISTEAVTTTTTEASPVQTAEESHTPIAPNEGEASEGVTSATATATTAAAETVSSAAGND